MSTGPTFGVELIGSLPIGDSGLRQAMPSHDDLKMTAEVNGRTAAGYEALLACFMELRSGLADMVSYTAIYGEQAGEAAADLLERTKPQ